MMSLLFWSLPITQTQEVGSNVSQEVKALKAGDLKAAAQYGCVHELRPVINAQ